MESPTPIPTPLPFGSAEQPKGKKSLLAWWGIIPAVIFVAIECVYGWPKAVVAATAPEFVLSYLVGRLLGGLAISLVIAWIVYRVGNRSQFAATITFSIMLGFVCMSVIARSRLPQPSSPESTQPRVAGEELVHRDHPVVLTIPEGWEQRTGFAAPILLVAVEPQTGNSLALLGFQMANERFTFIRKSAEEGLLEEAGPKCKIRHRLDTKVLGLPAYCVIADAEVQGVKASLARIMAEKPLNGFVYVVQFSKLDPGELDAESIPSIVNRVRLKK